MHNQRWIWAHGINIYRFIEQSHNYYRRHWSSELVLMAHYAFLDENNIVTEVIVGIDENELIEGIDPETWYAEFRGQRCVRTSYNGNIRGRFAGIGYTYDEERDVFITPKCHDEATLNETTTEWNCGNPIHDWKPNDVETN